MNRAALTYSSTNIGDDMQSLASELHLDRVDRFIDRDQLASLQLDEPHACILGSWFTRGDLTKTPPAALRPILFGFCAGLPNHMEGAWLDYLRQHAPVGARDLATVEWLQRHGVQAYWSGCVTLFAGRRLNLPPSRHRSGILLVDIDEATEQQWLSDEISSRAERITNHISTERASDPATRRASLILLMNRLAHAEAVVTQRLHIALPCVGLGTPVYVLPDPRIGFAEARFSGFDSFLPCSYIDETPRKLTVEDIRAVEIPRILEGNYDRLLSRLDSERMLSSVEDSSRRFLAEVDAISAETYESPVHNNQWAPGNLMDESTGCRQKIVWWSDKRIEAFGSVGVKANPQSAYAALIQHIDRWMAGEVDWEPGRLGALDDLRLADEITLQMGRWIEQDWDASCTLSWRLMVHRKYATCQNIVSMLRSQHGDRPKVIELAAELALATNDTVELPKLVDALTSSRANSKTLRARGFVALGMRNRARSTLIEDISALPRRIQRHQVYLRCLLDSQEDAAQTERIGRSEIKRNPNDEALRKVYGNWLATSRDKGYQVLVRMRDTTGLRRRPHPIPIWQGEPPPQPGAKLILVDEHLIDAPDISSILPTVHAMGWEILTEHNISEQRPDVTEQTERTSNISANWEGVIARTSAALLLAMSHSNRLRTTD